MTQKGTEHGLIVYHGGNNDKALGKLLPDGVDAVVLLMAVDE